MVYLTTVSTSEYDSTVECRVMVGIELERIWKKTAVVSCKTLSVFPEGTEENHYNNPMRIACFGPRFEPGTSRIRSRCVDPSTATEFE